LTQPGRERYLQRPAQQWISSLLFLLLLTALAVLVHGYHFGAEDQDVYVSSIEKLATPELFPHNAGFFTVQMHGMGTHFDQLFAWLTRHTGMSVAAAVLFGHLLSIFLIFLGLWQIAGLCLPRGPARWAAMLMVAGLLTLPVAGTRLFLVDQYLHPRALATAGIVLAIAAAMRHRWWLALPCLLFAAAMHPLMAALGASFLVFLSVRMPRWEKSNVAMLALLPMLAPVSPAWRQAVESRSFYFLWRWEWYELLGALAPFPLLWLFHFLAQRRGLEALAHLCRRLIAFGLFQLAVAVALTLPPPLLRLACYEPMRWLHIFYLFFVFIAGGLIGEYLLRHSLWRWLVLFVPLLGSMFYVQRQLFPASSHLEWGVGDGSHSRNEWVRAYAWIRQSTPRDAYFAMSPRYMDEAGQDYHGFRVLAQRSTLADRWKDPGAAAVFPELLNVWQDQVDARSQWEKVRLEDLQSMRQRFGANWAVITEDESHPLRQEFANLCRYRSQHICVLPIP
jgi:hypothetical protein